MIDTPTASSAIETVTDATFQEDVLDGRGPIVVEFMSYGCAHCRALEPVLQEIARNPERTATFFRVNVALDDGLARAYAIGGTPTLVMFSGAREVGRIEGPHPVASTVIGAIARAFD